MGYDQFIFSSLAERKSIYIEKIGVVSVIRRGSSRSDSKNFRELPHYDLIATKSAYDVSLREAVEGDYDLWFNSVNKSSSKGGRELDIPNCFILRTANDGSVTIEPYGELDLLLNPFRPVKSKRKGMRRLLLTLMLFILLGGGGYSTYYYFIAPSLVVEKAEVIFSVPKLQREVTVEEPPIITDTTAINITPEVVVDSVEMMVVEVVEPKLEPKVDEKSDFINPVIGNSYLVVGSFGDLESARSDVKRLERIYDGLKVYTTTKTTGGYINYLSTMKSYDDALEAKDELTNEFKKIKGIWVYRMK